MCSATSTQPPYSCIATSNVGSCQNMIVTPWQPRIRPSNATQSRQQIAEAPPYTRRHDIQLLNMHASMYVTSPSRFEHGVHPPVYKLYPRLPAYCTKTNWHVPHVIATPRMSISTWMLVPACAGSTPILVKRQQRHTGDAQRLVLARALVACLKTCI